MATLFCKLIIARPQLKTFSQVPVKDQPAVHIELTKQGYDDDGNLIVIV